MKFQNYNEFHDWMRWHDYVSVIIHEFPLLLVRRYDWLGEDKSTLMVQLFGFKVFQRVWQWGMTAEEADAAYDAAPAEPMSDEEIDKIVENVTDTNNNLRRQKPR